MMIAKIAKTPPPMKSNRPSSIGLSLLRRRRRGWLRPFHDEPGAADTGHAGDRAGRDVARGRGGEFMGLALGLDEHAAVATGRDADLDIGLVPDEIARRERLGRRRPAERAEDEPGDPQADEAERAADRGRLTAVHIEDLRGEQAAD